ncbi:MAG TPA: 4Fe-4S dicluster domain-containing protein, partial [Verrucomicrobiae bacterium]|nr:4Fe-4S dicluster domain-containing protein [Verrucomicrobiae bacterium]
INLPLQCRQCREPKCVTACMTGAMQVDMTTGLVVNQEEKCVGCWMCVMVCPYGAITQSKNLKVAKKCDQCLSVGHDPACVKGCPSKALKFAAVDEFGRETRRKFLTRFIQGEEA